MTLAADTVARAVPALLRGRVLAAVEAAQNAAGGPATAARCHQASAAGGLAPIGRDPRGFTTAARRVVRAQTGPDADGLELHRAGVDRVGAVLWWVSHVDEPSPATAFRIADQLARLGLARPDEAPLRTVARLLSTAPSPAAPEPPRAHEPPAPIQVNTTRELDPTQDETAPPTEPPQEPPAPVVVTLDTVSPAPVPAVASPTRAEPDHARAAELFEALFQ